MTDPSGRASLRQRLANIAKRWLPKAPASNLLDEYARGGRIPWSPGYSKFKNLLLQKALVDRSLLRTFADGPALPPAYGAGIDERIVEMPWAISRLQAGSGKILDAGSVLNIPLVLDLPALATRSLFVFSLELDWLRLDSRVSYIHGDFRDPLFRDGTFASIVCISTLEHVGMWPIPKPPFAENLAKPQPRKDLAAYKSVLKEFFRLLAPGGQLLLTVPFGYKEDQDWLQIYGREDIAQIKSAFGGECAAEVYFRYYATGWQFASAERCADAHYYNFVKTPQIESDNAAAARAVACLELIRPA
jgi:SAM-dependent methyltransferase